ncbi:MAG: DegT/DnrJ/EryC1/StrS family aminotransferase [Planctomycetes bacterium]|nr:DegT/DnrJ/EryC1/StrS family aminotransferase [Planctomycetota bacterium]
MKKNTGKSIPHSCPSLGAEESRAVARVISGRNVAAGRVIVEFEKTVAEHAGVKHAIAVNSGSSALHLSLIALGLGKNKKVILPSYCCSALLNSLSYAGCRPELVDTGKNGFNMDPRCLEKHLSRETGAIILPHMFGLPADVKSAVGWGIPVIEDCAMSLGASINGRKTGGLAEIGIVSFYATKMVCTGYGGIVLTNSAKLANKVRDLINYDNREDYIVRYNYLMSDMQAAMGIVQMKKLSHFIAKRIHIARLYSERLKGLPINLPEIAEGSVFHRYVIRFQSAGLLEKCIVFLKNRGIESKKPVYKPLHRYLSLPQSRFPNTEDTYQTSLSLPIYPLLDDTSVIRIANAVKEYLFN